MKTIKRTLLSRWSSHNRISTFQTEDGEYHTSVESNWSLKNVDIRFFCSYNNEADAIHGHNMILAWYESFNKL